MKNDINREFSVSMCVYGGDNPESFEIAVDSIMNQTVKPTEIVLVVDGPIPNELDMKIKKFERNSLFNVIRLKENNGHGYARRIGLNACKHELVAIMDADDISISNRFELQLNAFLKDEELTVVGGNIHEFIDEQNNIVGKRNVPENDFEIKEYLKTRCPMNQVTVMFKKKDIESVGGYIDWYCEEDYYLWIRLFLANKKFYNIQEKLVDVRVGKEMYSRRGGWKYFKSEVKLQKFMKDNKVINYKKYIINISKRLIVQVLLPTKVRGWVFKKFGREK